MTEFKTIIEWAEGADVSFLVAVTQEGEPVDLTGYSAAMEVRSKPASLGGTLHLRVAIGSGIEILEQTGDTRGKLQVTLPDTSGTSWVEGIADVWVKGPGHERGVPVLRFPVRLTRKVTISV